MLRGNLRKPSIRGEIIFDSHTSREPKVGLFGQGKGPLLVQIGQRHVGEQPKALPVDLIAYMTVPRNPGQPPLSILSRDGNRRRMDVVPAKVTILGSTAGR
jgi:hypothetical protein